MSSWSSGYVSEIGYTYGYYAELNPVRARLAFLQSGQTLPKCETACELGFGQGVSTNIHAAASGVKWYGNDFNPAQAAFAQELAQASGADVNLYDDSFEEFALRSDLPDFDFIGLHGIWSWVSDSNRHILVDFIRRKLKVGGVLYISYNTLPGWSVFAPMRHLMNEYAETMCAPGRGTLDKIGDAMEFVSGLVDTNPLYSRAFPMVGERIKKLKEDNRNYLAHEYFNKEWLPVHFSTMAASLEPCKVDFAGSANYLDLVEPLNMTPAQQEFLSKIESPLFRESVRDFMVNQQFRRDYWVKGVRPLKALERTQQLREQQVVLIMDRSKVSLKVKGALGEADMNAEKYNPVLDVLSDNTPRSISEIEKRVSKDGITLPQLLQVITVLCGSGILAPAQDESAITRALPKTKKLNAALIQQSLSSSNVNYLASPVTGGGINISRHQQMYLLALTEGLESDQEIAKFTWDTLAQQGHKLIKEGKVIENPTESLDYLTAEVAEFKQIRLGVLKSLKII